MDNILGHLVLSSLVAELAGYNKADFTKYASVVIYGETLCSVRFIYANNRGSISTELPTETILPYVIDPDNMIGYNNFSLRRRKA
jgi:hypothetical protein